MESNPTAEIQALPHSLTFGVGLVLGITLTWTGGIIGLVVLSLVLVFVGVFIYSDLQSDEE